MPMTMTLGTGDLLYQPVEDWEKLPEGWSFVEVPGVAVDSSDQVYLFNAGEHPVIVCDRDGNVLRTWGQGMFSDRTPRHPHRSGRLRLLRGRQDGDHPEIHARRKAAHDHRGGLQASAQVGRAPLQQAQRVGAGPSRPPSPR